MALLTVPFSGQAQSLVTIGEDCTDSSEYFPVHNYYKHSLTQQIYTADEIGLPGTISSVAFWAINHDTIRDVKIYLTSTTQDTFADGTWVAVDEYDLVFAGAVTFIPGEWTTITLTSPFYYNGIENLVVTVSDTSGRMTSQENTMRFRAIATPQHQALKVHKDDCAYDATQPGVYGTKMLKKNMIQFAIDPTIGCDSPHRFDTTAVAPHEATLVWSGNASAYTLEYKEASDTLWTEVTVFDTFYVMSDLLANTLYNARVKTPCDDGTISRIQSLSFATPIACARPTDVSVALVSRNSSQATLSWHENGTASQWQICLGDDLDNLITVDDTTYTFTDLDPEQEYTATVRAYCDDVDQSEWSDTVTFQTTDMVIIGSGDATSDALPTSVDFNFSHTQQIYTAEELGEAGYITSIAFHCSDEVTRSLSIYMVATDKETFDHEDDLIEYSEDNLVFHGDVDFDEDAWTSIPLDNYFNYDGVSNLALIINDTTNGFEGGIEFLVFNAPNQALSFYNDTMSYQGVVPEDGTLMNEKSQIRLAIGALPTCVKPMQLNVSYTGGDTAVVSWTSDAPAFNLWLNGEVTSGITFNQYTLRDLEAGGVYSVRVQADCGDETSSWTQDITFLTDLCPAEEQCHITLRLLDTCGDGWNGNRIILIDSISDRELGYYENTEDAAANEYQEYTVSVCADRPLSFKWLYDGFAYEAKFEILNGAGEVVYTCEDGDELEDDEVFFTLATPCTVCRRAAAVTADSVSATTVTLSWTGSAESYALYNGDTLVATTTGTSYTFSHLDTATTYTLGVQAICGEGDSAAIATLTVTTAAAPH